MPGGAGFISSTVPPFLFSYLSVKMGWKKGIVLNDVFPIENGDSEIMFRKYHCVLSLISHSRKLPWTSHGPRTWMVKFAQECSSELWEFSVSISQMLHGDIPDLPAWMFFFHLWQPSIPVPIRRIWVC